MTAVRGPQALYDIAALMLERLRLDLEGDAPDRITIYPGEIVWDHCECGMLAAGVDLTFTSDTFPAQSTQSACGGASYVGALTFGVVRCAPQPPEDDIAPLVDDLNAAALLAVSDQWHLITTVDCVLGEMKDDYRIMDALVGRAVSITRGDCLGSSITAQVQFLRGKNA